MRYIIWMIYSSFCRHNFIREEQWSVRCYPNGKEDKWLVVSATCKKCGWHRKYKKF